MGYWVMGHGSDGSPFLDMGHVGHGSLPGGALTHDDETSAQ